MHGISANLRGMVKEEGLKVEQASKKARSDRGVDEMVRSRPT
jgi:hypothetical protein